MHGCKSHYPFNKTIRTWPFFAPLLQFDLLEKQPSCDFDFLFPFIGLTEYDNVTVWLWTLIVVWQLYRFYNTDLTTVAFSNFDHRTITMDLITFNNFNYISLITTLFYVIFTTNFSGLLPYTQTITSQLLFTLILSLISMFLIWLHAFSNNKILMFNHFLPSGAPLILTPFIIVIELISNSSRLISISVRLFANMTSGHALLKILAGFGIGTLMLSGVWKMLFLFPFIIIFVITVLEIIIAFLQTYVFITLLLIYINEQE
jgi:ATP synthase subunit 6